MQNNHRKVILFIAALLCMSCSKDEIKTLVEYQGPLSEAENIEIYQTDKDKVKLHMKSPLSYEFKNGDREFPKGIFIEIFNEFGRLESTLKANEAYFFKEKNLWRSRGNVEVKNLEKNEQLNTEELFWKQPEKRIFTEKFVTIRQQGDIIYGEGLDAKEDLSEYTITKLSGDFEVDE